MEHYNYGKLVLMYFVCEMTITIIKFTV